MALSKPVSDLKLFTCTLCTGALKSPKILPCLHTFCEKCIHEHILNLGRIKKDKLTEFSCPVCRTAVKSEKVALETEWASLLQTNNSILAMMASTMVGKERECDACKGHEKVAVAKFWCKDCMETMCEDCMSKHSWIKFLRSHTITNLTEMEKGTSGIDLRVLPENCNTHPSEKIDSFCYDHMHVCCISCLTSDHKGCRQVKSAKDVTESIHIQTKIESLIKMKDEATELLKAKEDELGNFDMVAANTEDKAAKFVKSLKCRLDQLFETFTKQLYIYRDEHQTELQVCIRLLKQLLENLAHWLTTFNVVSNFGSKAQLLNHMDTVEKQLSIFIGELKEAVGKCKLISIAFEKDTILQQVDAVEQIGTFSVKDGGIPQQINQILKSGITFGIKLAPTFQTMKVEKVKTIHIPGSKFKCGVCIDEKHIMLGDYIESSKSKLQLFNLERESIISSVQFDGYVKNMCYDCNHDQVFISCHYGVLFRANVSGTVLHTAEKITFEYKTIGGLECYLDRVYITAHGAIYTFPTKSEKNNSIELNTCFKTDVDIQDRLVVHNRILIYTTKNGEVKGSTIDGVEQFCYKVEMLENISVLPSGLILVINRSNNGSLFLLSADGKQCKTLLSKVEHITQDADICLDKDGETFYIVGGEYIDVYRISG